MIGVFDFHQRCLIVLSLSLVPYFEIVFYYLHSTYIIIINICKIILPLHQMKSRLRLWQDYVCTLANAEIKAENVFLLNLWYKLWLIIKQTKILAAPTTRSLMLSAMSCTFIERGDFCCVSEIRATSFRILFII